MEEWREWPIETGWYWHALGLRQGPFPVHVVDIHETYLTYYEFGNEGTVKAWRPSGWWQMMKYPGNPWAE